MQDAILSALAPYGLKSTGRDKYHCNSPLRPGSNSHGFAVTINPSAPGGGLWHDHVTKEGGHFLDLAPRLNIPVPQDAKPKMSLKEPAYAGLDDYAEAHGVPAAVLAAAGWKMSNWRHRDGNLSPALEFPTPNGPRFRLIDGGDIKYIQRPGYKSCMFGLDHAVRLAEQTGQPLVLANGEVSTIVAQHYGVAACAQNMGEKKLTAENLAAIQAAYPAGDILIAPDCDSTGRKTAADLYTQLTEAGYRVRIVDLNGADGFDLANFAQLHQEGTAAALVALPDIPPPQADIGVYLREMERLRQENERLRHELQVYRERDAWQTKILTRPDIKLSEKAVMVGIGPILHMRRAMGSHQDDHTGTVPAAYKRLGEIVATSPSTVGRVIEIGEKLDMWRRDPETIQTKDGYDIQLQRLELLPAFDDPALAQPIERKKHGGARPNAGRKPKCAACPPGTPVQERTSITVQHICAGCGDVLTEETTVTKRMLQPDESFQDETGTETQQAATENQDETEKVPAAMAEEASALPGGQEERPYVYTLPSVSSLPSVPPHIEETLDLTTAIRAADRYSPPDELGRFAFKSALVWLNKREPDKAAARLPDIHDPQAYAIVAHLAARHTRQAPPT